VKMREVGERLIKEEYSLGEKKGRRRDGKRKGGGR